MDLGALQSRDDKPYGQLSGFDPSHSPRAPPHLSEGQGTLGKSLSVANKLHALNAELDHHSHTTVSQKQKCLDFHSFKLVGGLCQVIDRAANLFF